MKKRSSKTKTASENLIPKKIKKIEGRGGARAGSGRKGFEGGVRTVTLSIRNLILDGINEAEIENKASFISRLIAAELLTRNLSQATSDKLKNYLNKNA